MTIDDERIKVHCKECGATFWVYEDELDNDLMAHGAVFDTEYSYSRSQWATCPHCGALVETYYDIVDWDELTDDEQAEMLYWGTVSEADYERYCDWCLGDF